MVVNFKKLSENACIPTRAHLSDAGIDLYACLTNPICIPPLESRVISTEIAWEPVTVNGHSCCMIIKSRSGLAFNFSVEASNAGVLDRDWETNRISKASI